MNRSQRRAAMRTMKKEAHVCADGAYVLYAQGTGYVAGIKAGRVVFTDGFPAARLAQRFHEACAPEYADMLKNSFGLELTVRHQDEAAKGGWL